MFWWEGRNVAQRDGVTGEQLTSVPAVYVNKFYFTGLGVNARLTFCEAYGPDEPPAFRSAVLMTVADAIQLRDLMSEMLKDIQVIEADRTESDG